jgi:hypothetical protein
MSAWSRLRRLPAPVVDVGLALALAVAVCAAIDVADGPGTGGRTPGAYTLVLFRRRWPSPCCSSRRPPSSCTP